MSDDEAQALAYQQREAELIKQIKQLQQHWNKGFRPRPDAFLQPTSIRWKDATDE